MIFGRRSGKPLAAPIVSDILVVTGRDETRGPRLAAILRAAAPSLTVISAASAPDDYGNPRITVLLPEHIQGARLIIIATVTDRAAVVQIDGSADGRAFAALELVHLLQQSGAAPGGGLDGLVAAAASMVVPDDLGFTHTVRTTYNLPEGSADALGTVDAVGAELADWLHG